MSTRPHTPMHHRAEHGGVTRSLTALLARVEKKTQLGLERVVDHASQDSREVGPGGIFVATRGSSWDGHGFIAKALSAGASAIIAERHPEPEDGFDTEEATWVVVPDALYALACIAAAWYANPGRDVPVLATTGTNGKTTTSYLLRQVADQLGKKTGLISTVEILVDRDKYPTIFTTPPSPEFQRLLADMRDSGCDFAIVEASSHGLHQHRIAAFEVAVAGFTNLSRDHLDYHPTMEAYEAAKATLFNTLTRAACINIDSPAGRRMAELVAQRGLPLVTVSPSGQPATMSAREVHSSLAGLVATVDVDADLTPMRTSRTLTLRSPLIGRHNLENLLVALGMASLAGLDLDQVVMALATAVGAPGRLERVQLATPPSADQPAVFVDYAHSPDALDNVLLALRPLVPGKLVCVFGAGGDRDRGKRPEMARAAARHADRLVLTSDNPRTEDPETILDDIARGLRTEHHDRLADRAAAIAHAIALAGPDDAVLIAGKGHEDYQIVGTTRHPFDDRAVARQVLERLANTKEVAA